MSQSSGSHQAEPSAPEPSLVETTVSQRMIHRGRVINFRVDEALTAQGKPCTREVVEHPGGVVILPVLPDGRLIFVEQWRYALGRLLLELPAGKLDPGEKANPLQAAQRELAEETGYDAAHWEELTYLATAPGFCDEILWLYRATGLTPCAMGQHTDEDETIHVHALDRAEIIEKIHRREIVDAKTLSLLWFYCFDASAPQ